jgi:hypothetical protein
MNRLEYIWHYELRDWVQGGTAAFYFFTFGLGPAIVGYICGRWMPLWVRVLPLFVLLPAGVWWVLNHDHGFGLYSIGNLLYSYSCIRGLSRRAKHDEIPFWKCRHVDWIIVGAATVIMWIVYIATMPRGIA